MFPFPRIYNEILKYQLFTAAFGMLDAEEQAEKHERLRSLFDTSKKRKARKERARMLTKQREEELKAQGKMKGK